jgi:hypothetical protein
MFEARMPAHQAGFLFCRGAQLQRFHFPARPMSDSILYRVPEPGAGWPEYFPCGTYEDPSRLVARLQVFSQRHGLPKGLCVHVHETDATPLGIGRKHVGTINAGSVLMAGEIDLDRVRA